VRESFVLKGGVLLAAFDSRRPTKDVDLAGINFANDTEIVLELVRSVLDVGPPEEDGIEFAADTATAEVIREEGDYSGVRVHVEARLASAKLPFHVDVNVGDPIWPEPTTVKVPRLRGGGTDRTSRVPDPHGGKWAKHGHANKSRDWIVSRYFGAFNRSRRDRWVFGDRDSGAYLVKFAWTSIVRHRMVKGASSPDDPALAQYWADRRRRGAPPPMDRLSLRLLQTQAGRCPECGDLLLHADQPPQSPAQWEQWVRVTALALRKQSLNYQTRDGWTRSAAYVSYTPDVGNGFQPSPRGASSSASPAGLQGLREPDARKRAGPCASRAR